MFRDGDFLKLISSAPLWLVIFFILAGDQQTTGSSAITTIEDHEAYAMKTETLEPSLLQDSNSDPRSDLISYWKNHLEH